MKTIIMAGGRGSRISNLFPDIPKPLIPISNKPVLEWEIESLVEQGFSDIILTVSYLHEKIEEYFGNGSKWGARIEYYVEDYPLGNAGALFYLRNCLGNEPFLLLNADSVFDVDFKRMLSSHKNSGAQVTLFTHPNSHPYDSGIILTDNDGFVKSWLTKEDLRPKYFKNRVNAGLHVINPCVLDEVAARLEVSNIGKQINGEAVKVDLDRQILKPLCGCGKMAVYDSPEYVKDMGTPDRYYAVCSDFEKGIVKAKNLKNKQKAIFLDRDGTMNKYVGFLKNISEMELLEGVTEAIKLINTSGYLAVVVTNQPVIARGEVSTEELLNIHNKMETLLADDGAYIDGLYYCPHHPNSGFEGEVKELKIECECRKPKPGMILQAAVDFNIDLRNSWMIGDGQNDIKAGKAAGCHTALIGSGEYEQDISADSLYEAIRKIL